jgi:hypothetical protein
MMATTTFNSTPDNTTDASFRAWGSALSAALATVGMVKTADTGQIDWATVLKPSAVATYMGYEVWRFNDPLQTTAPVFLKLEYGSSSGSALWPALRAQLGKGSNGAGVLTSAFGIAAASLSSAGNASNYACFVSTGDGSMLNIAMWPLTNGSKVICYIDRSRSLVGAATGAAIWLSMSTNDTGVPQLGIYKYSDGTASSPSLISTVFAVPSSGLGGGLAQGASAPVFMGIFASSGVYWHALAVLAYAPTDAGVLAPVAVDGYGTYLPLGQRSMGGTSGYNLMMAWS